MNSSIKTQRAHFINSCETYEQVVNLEDQYDKAGVLCEVLKLAISNKKALIASDAKVKESTKNK